MIFELARESRVGARTYNQDRIDVRRTPRSILMVLADGMGGHPRGEVAAQVAVEHCAREFEAAAAPQLADPAHFLLRALSGSHLAILRRSAELKLPEAPRTTAVACVVQDGHIYWSHVGDSRLYIVRDRRVVTRTRDHSRVQQLIDAGRLREDALASHPDRNLLLQCLGGAKLPRFEPVEKARLVVGDIVLLCSDGLWGPLSARQLVNGLAVKDLGKAVSALAGLAEARAGRECDNVSVLAMLWKGEEAAGAHALRAPARVWPAARDREPDYLHSARRKQLRPR